MALYVGTRVFVWAASRWAPFRRDVLEKYGQAAGNLVLKRTGPEQINLSDPESRRRKPRSGKDAAAGDDAEPEQAPAPAAGATTGSDAQTVASAAQMRMKGTVQ